MRWRSMTGGAVDDEPYQRAAERFGGIPREEFARAIHLVEPDGTVTRAAAAGLKSLALAGRAGALWRLYQAVPPFAWSAEATYCWVARNRGLLDRLERALLRVP